MYDAVDALDGFLEVCITGEVFYLDKVQERRMLRANILHSFALVRRSCRSSYSDSFGQELINDMGAYKSSSPSDEDM